MKIVNKHMIMAAWLLAWAVSLSSASAMAQSATPAMPTMPATSTVTTQHSSVAMPSSSAASGAPSVAMPKMAASSNSSSGADIKIPDLSKPMPSGKKDDKKMDLSDNKVPDSVREVIKHLSNKTEDITLDDLNAAREAVAKLDALIDIEKRLADLDKIRNEREKENERKIADALPKTALMPPPSFMPAMTSEKPMEVKPPPAVVKPPPVEIDIIRIEGSNNRYGALIRDAGAVRMVHAGDHLSDGTYVIAVTTQGVELEHDKTTRIAQVKDVQAVFGDSP